jgi:hypothetical protein
MPDAWLSWKNPPNLAGRPIDVLLSVVPALIGGAQSVACFKGCKVLRNCDTVQAFGALSIGSPRADTDEGGHT